MTRTESIMLRIKFLKHLCLKVKLLREFSVIFLGNSLLVLLAWKVYGERIRNKFMTGRKVSKSLNHFLHFHKKNYYLIVILLVFNH